jgi:hypothetical protein
VSASLSFSGRESSYREYVEECYLHNDQNKGDVHQIRDDDRQIRDDDHQIGDDDRQIRDDDHQMRDDEEEEDENSDDVAKAIFEGELR